MPFIYCMTAIQCLALKAAPTPKLVYHRLPARRVALGPTLLLGHEFSPASGPTFINILLRQFIETCIEKG